MNGENIYVTGPYQVRSPHYITVTIDCGVKQKNMFPVVHANNVGVGNAIAWAATELSAQAVATGLNMLCAIRNQKG